jgi:hypothetical protein
MSENEDPNFLDESLEQLSQYGKTAVHHLDQHEFNVHYSSSREKNLMENITKAQILVEFTQDNFNDEVYEDFFDYNDLGIPIAIALTQEMIILTDKGDALIDETWNELCQLFGADPNGQYKSIDDVTLITDR